MTSGKASAFSAAHAVPAGLAVLFLALHLPYLPQSLEDLDSINFALGVHDFDVARHQPHPPGYPLFILIAKAVHAAVPADAAALAIVSIAAGALGVLAIAALFRHLDGRGAQPRWTIAATAVAMTTPLYWFTAARPLSDMAGLAAAIGVQAMTLAAAGTRALAAAAFCAGLATGLRSQVLWLTLPLLMFEALRAQADRGRRDATTASRLQAAGRVLMWFTAGTVLWFIPLVIVSGGPATYWHALAGQGSEDLGNIQMLWNNHGVGDVRDALYFAFVAPWAAWPMAAGVLVCAAVGAASLFRGRRRALIALGVGFGPYLLFDLLFQETFTGRYALPLVVPLAFLAVAGLRRLPWDAGLVVAAAAALFTAHLGGTSIAALSREKAPAFRLLDDMLVATANGRPAVLAMDRRESLDLRRPITWSGGGTTSGPALPAPPQHEWLEAVRYWNGGGTAPLWFVVDPLRTSIDLVQHGPPTQYRWPLPYPVLLSGVRPNEMDGYRVDRPEWYVGEGWALTPEAAGVATIDRRGPALGPIDAWVDRAVVGHALMIGGRSLDPAGRPRLTVRFDGRQITDETLIAGPFLRVVVVPRDANDPPGARGFGHVTVEATPGSRVAIEQFDASATRPLTGFAEGWHEQEFNPSTGQRWRWLSERGTLRIVPPNAEFRGADDGLSGEPLMLHLEGESSRKYFSRESLLTIRVGDRAVLSMPVKSDFSIDVPLEHADGQTVVLETDQVFSPADRGWRRSADRRHLGLRIFKAEIRKASRPAS